MSDADYINEDEGLRLCGGSSELYHAVIETYLKGIPALKSRILADQSGDIADYTIAVHAQKSSSRSIGAGRIGDMAYECELAGKADDHSKIDALTNPLLDELDGLGAYLEKMLDHDSADAGSIDAGSIDAGSIDAGSIDAGSTDAGSIDAGSIDAGSIDASSGYAGSCENVDANEDAGDACTGYANENAGDACAGYACKDAENLNGYNEAEVISLVNDIKSALHAFDSDLVLKKINRLSGISFSQEAADIIEESRNDIDFFDYDGVKDCIERLCAVLGI